MLTRYPFFPKTPIPRLPGLPKVNIKKVLDIVTGKRVSPLPGSILLCDLVGGEYHSGVYVGNLKIIHLEGNGQIRQVSPEQFLKRLGGLTGAKTIFVSCDEDSSPVADFRVVKEALGKVGDSRDYNLFFDNCHQFTSGCITGDFENADNFTWMLKMTAQKYLGAEKWLVWSKYDEYSGFSFDDDYCDCVDDNDDEI